LIFGTRRRLRLHWGSHGAEIKFYKSTVLDLTAARSRSVFGALLYGRWILSIAHDDIMRSLGKNHRFFSGVTFDLVRRSNESQWFGFLVQMECIFDRVLEGLESKKDDAGDGYGGKT
jgi:hypothetical protein